MSPRSSRSTTVVAVVPARDESARIAATVYTLLQSGRVEEVIVVDDGSTDTTAERAREAGARVLRLPRNRGKGAAVAAGVELASAPVLLLCDADLGTSAGAIIPLLDAVIGGTADMAVAAPPGGGPSGFGMVESFARWGIRLLGGKNLRRPLSGQRALRRNDFPVGNTPAGFGLEVGLGVDALRAGRRVLEIPCSFTHARTGRTLSGFAHRARQGAAVARTLASRARSPRRTRV